jgi:hypothetical protein
VLDRAATELSEGDGSVRAAAVRRDGDPPKRRDLHQRDQFVLRQLHAVHGLVRAVQPARQHDLDPVRTPLHQEANRPSHLGGPVDDQFRLQLREGPGEGRAVARRRPDAPASAPDARALRVAGSEGLGPCQIDLIGLVDGPDAGDTHPGGFVEVLACTDRPVRGRLEVPGGVGVVHQPTRVCVAVPQAEERGQPRHIEFDRVRRVVDDETIGEEQVALARLARRDVQPPRTSQVPPLLHVRPSRGSGPLPYGRGAAHVVLAPPGDHRCVRALVRLCPTLRPPRHARQPSPEVVTRRKVHLGALRSRPPLHPA